MVALLVFIMVALEIGFGRKKLLDTKGPLGDNVIKNPARYTYTSTYLHIYINPSFSPFGRTEFCVFYQNISLCWRISLF